MSLSDPSCPPVVVEGWGGAGDACVRAASAVEVLAYIQENLRAAFPQQWQSVAADGFVQRLTDLLIGAGRVLTAAELVRQLAQEMAEDVAVAHPAAH